MVQLPIQYDIVTNPEKNNKLSDFSKATLSDRYLLPGEDYQDRFKSVASHYADDYEHAQRIYNYMSDLWFMPATPVLSNGGTTSGLPISCFLNEAEDSLRSISAMWSENVFLAANGGGIGSYIGNVRALGETVRGNGESSGIIPFIKVQDALTLAISQGGKRRGSSAVYLPMNHPEIEEFIDIRKPTGGDPNRKALNIHHGVCITDEFMEAVKNDADWNLVSPVDGKVLSTLKARALWIKLLTTRVETGEPYMLFIDTVRNSQPRHQKELGLWCKTSNLCSEIVLPTGIDHLGKKRAAVCCLSSVNLEYYDEWKDNDLFIMDIMRFLDNVLEDFIATAPEEMGDTAYSAMRERSVGLGVMGFHSFLQSKGIPFDSVMVKVWNEKIFSHLRSQANAASSILADEKGACPDAIECGVWERFSTKLAIAPTASISIIASNSSPGIEPFAANSFTQKTLTGSFTVHNKNLVKLLEDKGYNTDDVWSSISTNEGSVQHLDFLTQEEKDVFKTAPEIDQRYIIEWAADRAKFICQAQSINLFVPGDINKRDLHLLHFSAWVKGIKSLYYCRSTSIQRADKITHAVEKIDYDECLTCQ